MLSKKNQESDELMPTMGGIAKRPDFIPKNDSRGTDHINKDDMFIPRICLAQKTSKEVDVDESRFIDKLKVGEMFNNITKEIYGKGPLKFTVLRGDEPRGIQFTPFDEGGGVVDFKVPLDDPRMKFKNGEKPEATMFYDFVIQMLDSFRGQVMALSFKSSGLKVARQLNTFMRAMNAPCFSGDYELNSIMQPSRHGSHVEFTVRPLGWCSSEDEWKRREGLFESYKEKNVLFDRETPEADAEVVDESKAPF